MNFNILKATVTSLMIVFSIKLSVNITKGKLVDMMIISNGKGVEKSFREKPYVWNLPLKLFPSGKNDFLPWRELTI